MPPPPTTTPEQTENGIYVSGTQGEPHYFIAVSHPTSGTLSGMVTFVYQDGQTSPVFSFSGPAQDGVATVRPDNGGAPISVTYNTSQLQLGECNQYLQYVQSLAECTFTYQPQS
jgi:hypothetical protein